MIAVTLLCVGKLREDYLRQAIAEYVKRLSRFCDFEIVEIPDERIPDNPSKAEETRVLESEGAAILARLPKGATVIVLAVEGETMTSRTLADAVGALADRGVSRIVFIIGGSLGLADAVKNSADRLLSFSRLTFPHQLMRLLAVEQVYRAFTILNHLHYHK